MEFHLNACASLISLAASVRQESMTVREILALMKYVWMVSTVILACVILDLLVKTVVSTSMTVVQVYAKTMEPVKILLMILYVHVLILMLGKLVKGSHLVHLNKTTVEIMVSATHHLLRALLIPLMSVYQAILV